MSEDALNLSAEDINKSIADSIATQEYVTQLMGEFTDMRIDRAGKLAELYDFSDPNVLAYILGDIVTLVENVHIAMRPMPQDGFMSFTPKESDGSGNQE